jgi:hypothetical protein
MGKAPTITGSFAKYEYDGAIFRCPSQCGLPNKIFSRLVIPAEVLAGKSEILAGKDLLEERVEIHGVFERLDDRERESCDR